MFKILGYLAAQWNGADGGPEGGRAAAAAMRNVRISAPRRRLDAKRRSSHPHWSLEEWVLSGSIGFYRSYLFFFSWI